MESNEYFTITLFVAVAPDILSFMSHYTRRYVKFLNQSWRLKLFELREGFSFGINDQ